MSNHVSIWTLIFNYWAPFGPDLKYRWADCTPVWFHAFTESECHSRNDKLPERSETSEPLGLDGRCNCFNDTGHDDDDYLYDSVGQFKHQIESWPEALMSRLVLSLLLNENCFSTWYFIWPKRSDKSTVNHPASRITVPFLPHQHRQCTHAIVAFQTCLPTREFRGIGTPGLPLKKEHYFCVYNLAWFQVRLKKSETCFEHFLCRQNITTI